MLGIRNNRGNATTAVLSMIAVAALVSVAYVNENAPVDEVNQTVALAKNNTEAMAKVKAFLIAQPAPTRRDLYSLKDQINEILVRDKARQVTGNPSLRTASQIQADKELKEQTPMANDPILQYGKLLLPFFLVIMVVLILVDKIRHR